MSGWDGGTAPGARRSVERLVAAGVRTELGGDGTALALSAKTLIVSPGLPDDLPIIRAARGAGLAVLDEAELGWRLDPRPWVAVTGTNGKSTTTRLVAAVLKAGGASPVLGGNTLGAPPLSATDRTGDVVVAEISSFQLERTERLIPEAAVLTQVGVDHLDRHRTRERYAEMKCRLFVRDAAHVPRAAVCIDDRFGRELAARLRERGARVMTFGHSVDADVRGTPAGWHLSGGTVALRTSRGERTIRTHLPGPHNASNVAGTVALAELLEIDADVVDDAIAHVQPPPGRFARVDLGCQRDVILDFAKNAGGVRVAIVTARNVTQARGSRLIAVVSAIPAADPGGLFAMGAAAATADVVVVTRDRWSPGEPVEPQHDLVAGARSGRADVHVVAERRAALARALSLLAAGDVLVVLGRPPGRLPQVGPDDEVVAFDDASELNSLA